MLLCLAKKRVTSRRLVVHLVCVIIRHISLCLIVPRLSIPTFIAQLTEVEGAWGILLEVVRLTAELFKTCQRAIEHISDLERKDDVASQSKPCKKDNLVTMLPWLHLANLFLKHDNAMSLIA